MLCIAICEDNIYARLDTLKKVTAYFERNGIEHSIADFSSGEGLLASGTSFDIAIMDIQMKEIDGMAASRELQRRGSGTGFLFLTSYPDYVFDSFDVNVISYLIKPLDEDKLASSLDKALSKADERDYVLVKSGSVHSKVYCEDIVSCESIGHKIRITTKNDRAGCIDFYESIESLCSRLGGNFCRIHRAFVVNLDYVRKRDGDSVFMSNGDILPLARRKRNDFISSMLAHLSKGL